MQLSIYLTKIHITVNMLLDSWITMLLIDLRSILNALLSPFSSIYQMSNSCILVLRNVMGDLFKYMYAICRFNKHNKYFDILSVPKSRYHKNF